MVKVFLSSTYRDLYETREAIAGFIREYGYDPVIFEKEDIPYEPNKLLEDSCYKEISNCSIFILIIKRNFGSKANSIRIRNVSYEINSVSQLEYLSARDLGIPIFVFIEQNSMAEYETYVRQGKPKDFRFVYLENIHLARFIEQIKNDSQMRMIRTYNTTEDIKSALKKQWAGLFSVYLNNVRKEELENKELHYINPFKLFYYRRSAGISRRLLSKRTGIDFRTIRKMEDAGIKKNFILREDFYRVTKEDMSKIADELKINIGSIKAGLPDDFLSQFLAYYFNNKGTHQRRKVNRNNPSLFKSKVVLFDFDGTLTKDNDDLTTWERIWLHLGYEINECAELHRQYSTSLISHPQWCSLTEKKFKAKKLSIKHLDAIASKIKLIDGLEEVIKKLAENKVKLYIISGSIRYLIQKVMGDLYKYFTAVIANEFVFNNEGYLTQIIGTKYDFEGKAHYLSQVIRDNEISPVEAFYIGNSLNDEWAHQSGAQTLCINPSMTNPDDPIQWLYSIRNLRNLNEIFKYLTY